MFSYMLFLLDKHVLLNQCYSYYKSFISVQLLYTLYITILCKTNMYRTRKSPASTRAAINAIIHTINYFINTSCLEMFSRTRKMMALALLPLDSGSSSESEIGRWTTYTRDWQAHGRIWRREWKWCRFLLITVFYYIYFLYK